MSVDLKSIIYLNRFEHVGQWSFKKNKSSSEMVHIHIPLWQYVCIAQMFLLIWGYEKYITITVV